MLPLSNLNRLKKLIQFAEEIELIKSREAKCLLMYYVDGFTMQKVADLLFINKPNAYYIRKTALDKMEYGPGFRSRLFAAYKDMLERNASEAIIHISQILKDKGVVIKLEMKNEIS